MARNGCTDGGETGAVALRHCMYVLVRVRGPRDGWSPQDVNALQAPVRRAAAEGECFRGV